jgi:MFS family permease
LDSSDQPSGGEATAPRLLTPAFVLVCLGTLAFWLSLFAIVPILPLHMLDVGHSEDLIGFVYGAGALTAMAGRIGFGWMIDRFGPRWFFLGGGLLHAVTSPPMGTTDSPAVLLALWLLKGLALGVFTTASIAYVSHLAAPERRGTAVGWWGATTSVATAIGPAAGAWIMDVRGVPAAFLASGIIGLAATLGALAGQPWVSALRRSLERPRIKLYVAAAVVPGGVAAFVAFATSAFSIFGPLRAREIGLGNVGFYLTVYAVALIAGRLVFGPLSDRRGRAAAIVPSLALAALAMGLIGFLDGPVLGLAVPVLFGFGVGGAMPGLLAWAVDRTTEEARAVAGSTFYSIYEVGLFLGATIVGQLLLAGTFTSFLVVSALLAVGLVWYVAAHRAERSTVVEVAGEALG